MQETDEIKRRLLALIPDQHRATADFELRMLLAMLETNSLQFIHQVWRPIAEERDQLKVHLDAALARPVRERGPKADDNLAVRFEALTTDHGHLQTRYEALQAAHTKLQADCDELLDDQRPRVRQA